MAVIQIALDVMGGDHAPEVPVAGAVAAARAYGVGVVLVGRQRYVAQSMSTASVSPRGGRSAVVVSALTVLLAATETAAMLGA